MNRIRTAEEMRYKHGEGVPPIDWRTMPEGKKKYQHYLCSREWAEKRNLVLERCGGVCERCGKYKVEQIHHLSYAHKYDELPEELAGWCPHCHAWTHGKSDYDPLCPPPPELRELSDLENIISITVGMNHSWDEHAVIHCPKCQDEYSYIREVFTVTGSDDYKAGYENVGFTGTEAKAGRQSGIRSSALIIVLDGECGHSWELVIQYAKGINFVRTQQIADQEPEEDA